MGGMMDYQRWPEDETKELQRLRDFGFTIKEIADKLGRSPGSVYNKLKNEGIVYNFPCTHRRGIQSTKKREFPDVEKLLKLTIEANELIRQFDPRERETLVEYLTSKWIGIPFISDFHFDHYKTDLKTLVKEIEEIGAEEDVFVIHNGDTGDYSDTRFSGLNIPSFYLPLDLRLKLAFYLISKIKNLLVIVDGCHDDWVKNRKFDIIRAIVDKHNELGLPTIYFGYGGFLNFKVGRQLYRFAIYHKYPGESQYNIFHPCLKIIQQLDATADIVCVSHRHDKMGISYQYIQHKPRVLIRTGSHQYLTDYAWKQGFGGAVARSPMVLLNGTEKRMLAFPHYKEGMEELRRLNRE